MQKIQDLAKIVSVEINDTLKEVNRELSPRGNWRTLVRVVVAFEQEEGELSPELAAKVAKLNEAAKGFMKRTKRGLQISNLFDANDILPDGVITPNGGFTDEMQDKLLLKIKEFFNSFDNISLFTAHTFSVNELSEYNVLYDTESGTPVRERSYLSSGLEDNDERIKNILSAQIARQIEDGDLSPTNPNAKTESEQNSTKDPF